MIKQTLQRELTNVPTDASQVCSPTSSSLNRNESASEMDKVLSCNNPDVKNKRRQVARPKVYVPVLSVTGSPLMPCTFTKAIHLLKGGRAKIACRNPICIQLTFVCENQVQDTALGVDTGYSHVGFSTITKDKETVSCELSLDNNTSKRLIERKVYRRNRRNRLRYRKPRFNNRKKPEGWLPHPFRDDLILM